MEETTTDENQEKPFIVEKENDSTKNVLIWVLITIGAIVALFFLIKITTAAEVVNVYNTSRNFSIIDNAQNTGDHVHVLLTSSVKKYPYIYWGNESVSCNYLAADNWACILTVTPFMNGINSIIVKQDDESITIGDYYFNGTLFYTTKNQCHYEYYNITQTKNVCTYIPKEVTKMRRICEVRNSVRTCEIKPFVTIRSERVCEIKDVIIEKKKQLCSG